MQTNGQKERKISNFDILDFICEGRFKELFDLNSRFYNLTNKIDNAKKNGISEEELRQLKKERYEIAESRDKLRRELKKRYSPKIKTLKKMFKKATR